MTKAVILMVNEEPIEIDYFVQGFIDHTIRGIVSALEGVGEAEHIGILIEGDDIEISVNNTQLPVNPFVCAITTNTIKGMVKSLKGVNEVKTIKISISK
ncbi:hypothetical protein ACFLS8_02590 [Chloroflexota bacterium]